MTTTGNRGVYVGTSTPVATYNSDAQRGLDLRVGDLWSDTTGGSAALKRCTALGPITFVTTETAAAASKTAAGIVELATVTEIDAGTDPARVMAVDDFNAADWGAARAQITVIERATDVATGDGKADFIIPDTLDGWNLVYVHAKVISAGTTNTLDVQIANVTETTDMLSTKLTVDSGETGSDTAATPAVIDTTKDDVAENDHLRIDVDAVHATPAKGLIITMGFRKP